MIYKVIFFFLYLLLRLISKCKPHFLAENLRKCLVLNSLCWVCRLRHMKNKGVQQSHALSRNSEAMYIWKVARHPPNRCVVVYDDYSFKNTTVFFLLQWNAWVIIKLKLKQASKEFHRPKIGVRLAKCFSIRIAISQSTWWFKASLEWFSWMKYCF